jgi:hypothetical protein
MRIQINNKILYRLICNMTSNQSFCNLKEWGSKTKIGFDPRWLRKQSFVSKQQHKTVFWPAEFTTPNGVIFQNMTPENICRKISSLFQLNRLPIYFNSPITDNSLFKPVINGNQLKGTGPDLSALVSFKY